MKDLTILLGDRTGRWRMWEPPLASSVSVSKAVGRGPSRGAASRTFCSRIALSLGPPSKPPASPFFRSARCSFNDCGQVS